MSLRHKPIQYFVEGECEEKLINALKTGSNAKLVAGKVKVFNVIKNKISKYLLAQLKKDAIVILIYDTDIPETEVLEKNIKALREYGIKIIYHVQSIKNFEGEILYSTQINDINEFFASSKVEEFKNKFINHRDILSKLKSASFDADKLWSRSLTEGCFSKFDGGEAKAFIHMSKKR